MLHNYTRTQFYIDKLLGVIISVAAVGAVIEIRDQFIVLIIAAILPQFVPQTFFNRYERARQIYNEARELEVQERGHRTAIAAGRGSRQKGRALRWLMIVLNIAITGMVVCYLVFSVVYVKYAFYGILPFYLYILYRSGGFRKRTYTNLNDDDNT